MKKIIVTEAQFKMLQNEGWEYTPEKIDAFLAEAKADLEKGLKTFDAHYTSVIMMSIGEMMDEPDRFQKFLDGLNEHQNNYEAKYNKYYDIVNMYDFMDLPDNVNELDKLVTKFDELQMNLYKLHDSVEEVLDAVKTVRGLKPGGEENLDEQLLKNLGDKIKTGVQNVKDKITNAVNPKQEITVPGNPPSKGRNMDQLRAEWSKINEDKSNTNGYGEAVSPDMNNVDMAAKFAANANITCYKLNASKASFGYEIVDEATFQLENGNYFKMVVLKPTNVRNVIPKTTDAPCPPSTLNFK